MTPNRTLLIYSTLPLIGGNSTNTLTVAKEFRQLGWKVLVLTRHSHEHGLSAQNIELLRGMGCEVETLTGDNGKYGAASLRALWWVFRKGKGNVFVSLCMGSVAPLLARIGRFRKSIFYLITHEERPEVLDFLIKSKQLFTDIGTVSPITAEPVRKLLDWPKDVEWLPQFSDFGPGNRALAEKRADRRLTFGFLGTLNAGKGVQLLMEAWPKFKDRADLKIAGDGPLKADVQAAATSGSGITYAGAFNAATREAFLAEYFASIDYLIAPSVNTMEGIPTVILEAISYGVPVLASNLGGTRCFGLDWLKPPYPDVVRLFDLVDLETEVARFIGKGAPGREYQEACLAYYRQWFSNAAVLRRWVDITA